MGRECFKHRGLCPQQCPQCSCCHCGADRSSQLQEVLEQHLPERGDGTWLSQSFLSIPSIPSCWADPSQTPLLPPVLPVPLCSRTRMMLQPEKVLDLFERCCGNRCALTAPMSELHPTLVPVSQLQRSRYQSQLIVLHLPVLQLLPGLGNTHLNSEKKMIKKK